VEVTQDLDQSPEESKVSFADEGKHQSITHLSNLCNYLCLCLCIYVSGVELKPLMHDP
jgi:hypothetical protein